MGVIFGDAKISNTFGCLKFLIFFLFLFFFFFFLGGGEVNGKC